MPNTIHEGRNIKRFREMLGIKQETLALELGDDWNQKKISLLEGKEVIDTAVLERVADVLKVPADAIRNFNEETALINIQNNYEGSGNGNLAVGHQQYEGCSFNPIDKVVELYERLLESEREKVAMLREMGSGSI